MKNSLPQGPRTFLTLACLIVLSVKLSDSVAQSTKESGRSGPDVIERKKQADLVDLKKRPRALVEGKHLLILSGQSNMGRFNEKLTFVPAIETALGRENVIIVKDAHGGRPIRRWYLGWDAPVEGKNQEIGDLYAVLMDKVVEAIEGEEIRTVTVLWMQGEQDAREPTGKLYRQSLEGLFKQFEVDLGRTDISYVIGRLSDFGIDDENWPYWNAIRLDQQELAETHEHIVWINTDDLNDGINKKGGIAENELHYTKEGYQKFGERLAAAAVALIQARLED